MTAPLRVLVLDDAVDLVWALQELLQRDPRFTVTGSRSSADRVLEAVEEAQPDVVVIDLTMPGRPPLQAIKMVSEKAPRCHVVAYTGYDDSATREAAFRAGVRAFVSKEVEPIELLEKIYHVATERAPQPE